MGTEMLNQGTYGWLEDEAQYIRRKKGDLDKLRKEHRQRLLSLLDSSLDADEVHRLMRVWKLTDAEEDFRESP